MEREEGGSAGESRTGCNLDNARPYLDGDVCDGGTRYEATILGHDSHLAIDDLYRTNTDRGSRLPLQRRDSDQPAKHAKIATRPKHRQPPQIDQVNRNPAALSLVTPISVSLNWTATLHQK